MWEAVFQALVLGVLQGLTEFLPVSSSGHLLLLPWLAGWQPLGLTFDVMLHVGTLAAVLVYFREDWKQLTLQILRKDSNAKESLGEDVAATPRWEVLALATLPAVLVGGLFIGAIGEHLRGPLVVAFNLSLFGLLMAGADQKGSRISRLEEVGYRQAIWIGLAQALALMPGVSRSGVTITAALLLGMRRLEAARFSFLMATPIIALAAAKSLFDLWTGTGGPDLQIIPLLAGMAAAAFSGWLCIRFFLRFLRTHSLIPFAVYRLLLAALVLALWWRGS